MGIIGILFHMDPRRKSSGEKVAWYSRSHNKMVIGEVNNIKGLDKCTVFRKPETEEEKKSR